MLLRYTPGQRQAHWITAIAFVLLALSGLAFFHPSMFWAVGLLGGGQWARILHPFIGVVMFLAFLSFALGLIRHNAITANDRRWLGRIGDLMAGRHENLPEVGRYNAGQKVLYWVMLACMLALLASGIVIWRPYFTPAFTIAQVRLALVVHAGAGFLLLLGMIVHIYAAYWTRGSIRAMVRGSVTRWWAQVHHPGWYREVTGGK
jgi:formate dehydrogenase subunit gamma